MSDTKEVFISYTQTNADLAQYLCNTLEGAGVSCWIAPRDVAVGQSWAACIVDGLSTCSVMALLVSSAALASQEVAKEVDLANSGKKSILPIRIEDVLLSGPLQYHLSMRQWVDAIEGEKLVRFQAAKSAVLRLLKKSAHSAEPDSSPLGQARLLVADLNQTHALQLDFTNAVFSAQDSEDGGVSIFYPQRIGATGIDLICAFDCKEKTIRIVAHGASDGDPLKDPFGKLIERKYKSNILPDFSWKDRGRRWEFVTLMPTTRLTTSLLDESTEVCFSRFADHVRVLSNTVFADLLKWSAYAKEIVEALGRLEMRIKEIFPEDEGWCIRSTEGGRLNGFRKEGKINVFKRAWQPAQDNYQDRGLLSFTLEAGGDFFQDLKIGVLKYEKWFDLGEFDQRIFEEGRTKLDGAIQKNDWYPLAYRFPDEWQDAGLVSSNINWRGKLDRFVDTVIACFKTLKEMTPLIDEACASIPALQDKDPAQIPESGKKDWWLSAIYVRNRLRQLTERVKRRNPSQRLRIDFQFRHHEWQQSSLLAAVKVGSFDIAIAFRFSFHKFTTDLLSLEPPDFETAVAKAFLAKHYPTLHFPAIPQNSNLYHGLSLCEWMDRCEQLVEDHIDAHFTAMNQLATHLEQCRDLSKFVTEKLGMHLRDTDGWVIENYAANSLETSDGITIYRKSWLAPRAKEMGTAPFLVQIVPNQPCFDELWLAVSLMGQPVQALDRIIARVEGACDFAFQEQVGQGGKSPVNGIWARPLLPPFQQTGGSRFGIALATATEREILSGSVEKMAQTIMLLEPILAEASRLRHDLQLKANDATEVEVVNR